MLELNIKANTLAELHSKILESANTIGEFVKPQQPVTAVNNASQPVTFVTAEQAVQRATHRAPRRTKAEIAAGIIKVAPVVEVVEQPVITIPPMPTTETRVELPVQREVVSQPVQVEPIQHTSNPTVQQPVADQPTLVAQAQQPVNAYTFEVFKTQYIHILTQLSTEGKINTAWLESTKPIFDNKPIHEWGKNEPALRSLFTSFIEWDFIQELKV